MSATQKAAQADLLNRLYSLKQQQLARATEQMDALRCRILAAEARAISDALKSLR